MESEAPSAELVAAIQEYDERMREAGVLISVERLQPPANGTRLTLTDGQFRVVDGPFTETHELIAGVTVVEVASKDEAIAWMKQCPTLRRDDAAAEFEIRPVFDVAASEVVTGAEVAASAADNSG